MINEDECVFKGFRGLRKNIVKGTIIRGECGKTKNNRQ